jgi:PAS domain S-box-containing protein
VAVTAETTLNPARSANAVSALLAYRRALWAAAGVLLLACTTTVLLWKGASAQEDLAVQARIGEHATRLAATLSAALLDRVQALERQARRWELRGGTPRAEWEADAAALLHDYPDIYGIDWVDRERRVRWVMPKDREGETAGQDLGADPRSFLALDEAARTRKAGFLRELDPSTGQQLLQVLVPIDLGHRPDGFIRGVIRVRDLVLRALPPEGYPGLSLVVRDGTDKVFEREVAGPLDARWSVELPITSLGGTWLLAVGPGVEFLAEMRYGQPETVLVSGLALTVLLSLAVFAVMTARRQHAELVTLVRERERHLAALERSEREARVLLESAPAAMVVVDARGRIALVNAETERLFGYSREVLIGLGVETLLPARFREAHSAHRAEFAARPRTRAMGSGIEIHGMRRDGTEIPLDVSLGPFETPEGTCVFCSIIDVGDRKAQERQLRQALAEKETLLKEVYHRVKNNLQVITSLFELQGHQVQDPRAQEVLDDGVGRVRTMALVHECLYRSKDLEAVAMRGYVEDLVAQVLTSFGGMRARVQVGLEIADLTLGIETALPAGLILNELISNAFRHAFPDGRSGTLRVALTRERDAARLTVSDDGVGLPEGLEVERARSLGLELVMALTRQLGGRLAVERGAGTRFVIDFLVVQGKRALDPR